MNWCEGNNTDYIIGLAKNERLTEMLHRQLNSARKKHEETGMAARVFTSFCYTTRESWSKYRSVIAKAEHLDKGSNPRFVVTSLPGGGGDKGVYEQVYCARGEMENRIKER